MEPPLCPCQIGKPQGNPGQFRKPGVGASYSFRKAVNGRALAEARDVQAEILQERDDPDGEMALYRDQEALCRELGEQHGLFIPLGNRPPWDGC
jgi:hypothetical protein